MPDEQGVVHEEASAVEVQREEKTVAGVREENQRAQKADGGEAGQTGVGDHEGRSGDGNGAFPNDAAREKCGLSYANYHASLPCAASETCVACFAEAA